MSESETTDEKLAKIHNRVDEVYKVLIPLAEDIVEIRSTCGPCKEMISAHQKTLHGNGKDGLKTEVAKLRDGKGDTLSVPSVIKLLAAFAALSATIIGAVLFK